MRLLARLCAGLGVVLSASLAGAGASPRSLSAQAFDPSAIDAVFADIEAEMPGCAVGVYRAGEILYRQGYGSANLDYGLPITPSSVFYLGSVGKQFTAAAIQHAADAGHLGLDDPVQRWIPEMPEYGVPVTVRHLVHHTSGVRDYLTLLDLAGIPYDVPMTDGEIVELIAAQEALNFDPGERYLYSNSGYFLLAQIVERATGRSLREYLEEHFFGPLGMGATRVHDDRREPIPLRVVGYRLAGPRVRMDHPWSFDKVGSGGVYSSIEDMARWDRNWFTEEVGGEGFSDRLLQVGGLADGTELPYAFGLSRGEYRGRETVGHGGALAGFRSQLLRFPELETTAMVACSFPSSDPAARARRVADVVLAESLEPVVAESAEVPDTPSAQPELSNEELERFVGDWEASIGIQVAIARAGSGLVFIQGGQRVPLEVRGIDHLALPAVDAELRFSDLRDGRYHHQEVVQRGQTFTAERIAEVEPVDWTPYVGVYHAPEIDAEWEIVADGDRARLVSGSRTRLLEWVGEARLATSGLQIRVRLEGDRVAGLTVDAGRAQGIRFERVER